MKGKLGRRGKKGVVKVKHEEIDGRTVCKPVGEQGGSAAPLMEEIVCSFVASSF